MAKTILLVNHRHHNLTFGICMVIVLVVCSVQIYM
jgi:hypothetical protein